MPNNDDERNTHPVCGQKQATDALATPARAAVCGITAMLEAESRTHRNVGYKNSVSRFHMLKMTRCNDICNRLVNGTYYPSKGEKYEIFEPKYRVVTSSRYKDRIPQASFTVNYFYPQVVPNLIEKNCACLKGRGTDIAREALRGILRRAKPTDYCVKADMKNYFGSIDHELLYQELGGYITDQWARAFFRQTVENTGGRVGLDLGSEVYQLSATSFLNRLDHILDNGNYIRYQDDLIAVGSKDECFCVLAAIRAEAERLSLTISEKKTFIQPIKRPVRFLGFSFLRHPSGRVTMRRLRDKLRHEKRKLRRMRRKGVPIEQIYIHYQCVRTTLKKGCRSDLKNMDLYFDSLFGEVTNGNSQRQFGSRAQGEGSRLEVKPRTRGNR